MILYLKKHMLYKNKLSIRGVLQYLNTKLRNWSDFFFLFYEKYPFTR